MYELSVRPPTRGAPNEYMAALIPAFRSAAAARGAIAPPSECPVTTTEYDGYNFCAARTAGTTTPRASSQLFQKPLWASHPEHRSVGVRPKSRFVSQLSRVWDPRKEIMMRLCVWSVATKPVTSVREAVLGYRVSLTKGRGGKILTRCTQARLRCSIARRGDSCLSRILSRFRASCDCWSNRLRRSIGTLV